MGIGGKGDEGKEEKGLMGGNAKKWQICLLSKTIPFFLVFVKSNQTIIIFQRNISDWSETNKKQCKYVEK